MVMIIVRKDGAAIADKTPTMVTTINNSMMVKPDCIRVGTCGRALRKPRCGFPHSLRLSMDGTPRLPFGTRLRYLVCCGVQLVRDEWQIAPDKRIGRHS